MEAPIRPPMMARDQPMGNLPPNASFSQTIFRPDEHEHEREAVLQQHEALDGAGQQEIEGAQAEDREDVGRENDQRLAGEGEDGGDGIDGEDDVAGLGQQEGEQQRRGIERASEAHEELLAVQL